MNRSLKLSSDAKFILALMEKQPQTQGELLKSAKITRPTFYRVLRRLSQNKKIKRVEGGYVLWNYDPLEGKMRKVLKKLQEKTYDTISIEYLAGELGQYPDEAFKRLAWQLVGEYYLRIGKKTGPGKPGRGNGHFG